MALSRHPSLQTGRAVFPHPAFQLVGYFAGLHASTRTEAKEIRPSRVEKAQTASSHCSCERSRQAIHPHFCCLTLPCLACGTRDSFGCSRVAVLLPPSYPL